MTRPRHVARRTLYLMPTVSQPIEHQCWYDVICAYPLWIELMMYTSIFHCLTGVHTPFHVQ